MLNFQRRTDSVFQTILTKAFEMTLENLRVRGVEFLETYFPDTSEILSVTEVSTISENLKRYHQCPEVYSLNRYHFLLIYEVLESFSNNWVEPDEGGDSDLEGFIIPGTKIYRIDFDSLIGFYFPFELLIVDESFSNPHQAVFIREEIINELIKSKPSKGELENYKLSKREWAFIEKDEVLLFTTKSVVYPDPQWDGPGGKEWLKYI